MRVFFSGFLRVFLFPALLFHPLFGRETGGGAEGLEEVLLTAESGLHPYGGYLLAGLLPHQSLGIVDAVVVDILAEGATLLCVDAGRDAWTQCRTYE